MPPRVCPRLVLLLALTGLMAACRPPADARFAFSSDAPSRAGLVALTDGVLVGNEAGRLVRLDARGQVLWRVELDREIAAAPTVSGDSVLVGTVGGTLLSLTLSQGTERWRLTGQPAVLTPLMSDAEALYVVEPEGGVRALWVRSGEVRWRSPPGPPPSGPPRPLPSPVLAGALLVVGGDTGLVALSVQDGAVRWRMPLGQVLGMRVEGGTLYAATRGGEVLALDAAGHERWRRPLADALGGAPGLARGLLWVGTADGQLLGLSPEDGQERLRLPLPAPLVTSVVEFPPWVLVPTRSPQGWLLAQPPDPVPPAFTLRTDTALSTRPVLVGDQLFVLGQDGRVLSWTLRPKDR